MFLVGVIRFVSILLVIALVALFWLAWNPRELLSACAGVPAPDFLAPRMLPNSLVGARVMLNPGHGLTLRDNGSWAYQRPLPDGEDVFVLEDASNARMARTVRDELTEAQAVVLSTRELDLESGNGISGQDEWREAARHHLKASGVPEGIWNSSGGSLHRDCLAGQDLRARPFYANFERADLLISLHSNAGMAWARGTQVLYDERIPASACLAQNLARTVPAAIRQARPEFEWPAGQVIGSRNKYGELSLALMPSVILEVGFHTNRIDGSALQQPSFRRAVAAGIRAGTQAFLENPSCQ
jgi:N-acetylmuramoyl-L-alanine amidase